MITALIHRLREDIPIPCYATAGSAGFDLAPCEETVVPAHGYAYAPTGLVFGTPEGYALYVFARSSLLRKTGLMIGNGVGVLDEDFCGPSDALHLVLFNTTDKDVTVAAHQRVAQGIFMPVLKATFVEGIKSTTNRGGLGSTG